MSIVFTEDEFKYIMCGKCNREDGHYDVRYEQDADTTWSSGIVIEYKCDFNIVSEWIESMAQLVVDRKKEFYSYHCLYKATSYRFAKTCLKYYYFDMIVSGAMTDHNGVDPLVVQAQCRYDLAFRFRGTIGRILCRRYSEMLRLFQIEMEEETVQMQSQVREKRSVRKIRIDKLKELELELDKSLLSVDPPKNTLEGVRKTGAKGFNDKYINGPVYGHRILRVVSLDAKALETATKLWSLVTIKDKKGRYPDFNLEHLVRQFRQFMQLLYSRMYYSKLTRIDEDMKLNAALKLNAVSFGCKLVYNDRRPMNFTPAKTGVLGVWLKYYKFCLREFCGLTHDIILELIDLNRKSNDMLVQKLTKSEFVQMQGNDKDSTKEESKEERGWWKSVFGGLSTTLSKASESTATAKTSVSNILGVAAGDQEAIDGLTTKVVESAFKSFWNKVSSQLTALKDKTSNLFKEAMKKIVEYSYMAIDNITDAFDAVLKAGSHPYIQKFTMLMSVLLFIVTIYRWFNGETGRLILMVIIQHIFIGVLAAGSATFINLIGNMKRDVEMNEGGFMYTLITGFITCLSMSQVNMAANILTKIPCIVTQTKEFFTWVIDKIYYLACSEHYFPEYNTMEKLEKFVEKVQEIMFEPGYEMKTYMSTARTMKVMAMEKEIQDMRTALETVRAGYNPSKFATLSKTLVDFEAFTLKVKARSIVTQARIEPVVINLYGATHQGKSRTMSMLPKLVYDKCAFARPDLFPMEYHPGMVFAKSVGQNFYDGIDISTFCYITDDFIQQDTSQISGAEITEFITTVSPVVKALGGASVENKNTLFAAFPLYIMSTNATDDGIRSSGGVRCPDAFFRRRHFHLNVQRIASFPEKDLAARRNDAWRFHLVGDPLLTTPAAGEPMSVMESSLYDTGIQFSALMASSTKTLSFTIDQIAVLVADTIIRRITARDAYASTFLSQNFAPKPPSGAPPSPEPPIDDGPSGMDVTERMKQGFEKLKETWNMVVKDVIKSVPIQTEFMNQQVFDVVEEEIVKNDIPSLLVCGDKKFFERYNIMTVKEKLFVRSYMECEKPGLFETLHRTILKAGGAWKRQKITWKDGLNKFAIKKIEFKNDMQARRYRMSRNDDELKEILYFMKAKYGQEYEKLIKEVPAGVIIKSFEVQREIKIWKQYKDNILIGKQKVTEQSIRDDEIALTGKVIPQSNDKIDSDLAADIAQRQNVKTWSDRLVSLVEACTSEESGWSSYLQSYFKARSDTLITKEDKIEKKRKLLQDLLESCKSSELQPLLDKYYGEFREVFDESFIHNNALLRTSFLEFKKKHVGLTFEEEFALFVEQVNEPQSVIEEIIDMKNFLKRVVSPSRDHRRSLYKDLYKILLHHRFQAWKQWYEYDVERHDPRMYLTDIIHKGCVEVKPLKPHLKKIYNYIRKGAWRLVNFPHVNKFLTTIYCEPDQRKDDRMVRPIARSETEVCAIYFNSVMEANFGKHFRAYEDEGASYVVYEKYEEELDKRSSLARFIAAKSAITTFWSDLADTLYGFYYKYRWIVLAILGYVVYVVIVAAGYAFVPSMVESVASKLSEAWFKYYSMDSLAKGQMARMKGLAPVRMQMFSKARRESKVRQKTNWKTEDEKVPDEIRFRFVDDKSLGTMTEEKKMEMQSMLTNSIDSQISKLGNAIRFAVFRYDDGQSVGSWVMCSGKSIFVNKHFFTANGDNWTHVRIQNGSESTGDFERQHVTMTKDVTFRDHTCLSFYKGVYDPLPSLNRFLVPRAKYKEYLGAQEVVRIQRNNFEGKVTFRYVMGTKTSFGREEIQRMTLGGNPWEFKLSDHVAVVGATGEKGDCGLPYFMVDATGRLILLGYHCATVGECAMFTPLFKEDLPKDVAYVVPAEAQCNERVVEYRGPYIPPAVEHTSTLHKHGFDGRLISLGTVPKGAFMPSETAIRPSLFQGDGVLPSIKPITTAPAMLKPTWVETDSPEDGLDVKIEDCPDGPVTYELRKPLHNAVIKLKAPPIRIFPSWIFELARREPEKLFHGFFPKNGKRRVFKILTLEEALAYLDMSTSVGIDFQAMGYKSRHELWNLETGFINPDLRQAVERLFVAMKAGFSLKNVVSGCLKDETRDLERVLKGKTRLFCVGSLAHLIVTVMVMGDMVSFLKEFRALTDVAIGVNPHGREWTTFAERLKKFNRFGGGDFSGYDTSIVYAFGYLLFMAMKWYSRWTDPLHLWYLECVCTSSVAPLLLINDQLYWLNYMNSSGGWLTGFLNSFVNVVIFNSFLWLICQEQNIPFDRDALLAALFYGDDNLWAVAMKIAKFFTMKSLAEYIWIHFGMVYTTPQKDAVSSDFLAFEELEFLCRRFSLVQGGLYKAPLSEDSINGMLLWIKKSSICSPSEQLAINVEQAMMEFFHYGKSRFLFEQKLLQRYCEHFDVPYTGLRYEEYHARWVGSQLC